MKKLIVILALFSTNLFCQNELPFTLIHLDTDFNGIINNNNTIFAYGKYGVMLYSVDNCKNWKQINLDNNLNITKVVAKNNILFALCQNYIYKSLDNGKTWFMSPKFQNDILDISIYFDNIIILEKGKIYSLTFDYDNTNILNLQINDKFKVSEFQLTNNYCFIPIANSKLLRYKFENKLTDTIDFAKLKLCTSCYQPYKIKLIEDKIFVFQDNILLSTEDYGNSWKQISNSIGVYTSKNNQIFSIDSYTDTKDKFYNADIIFNKVKKDLSIEQVNRNIKKRNIKNINFNDIQFINDSTIVAVGNNKLIALSNNFGLDWEIKNYLNYDNSYSHNFINDSLAYIISNNDFSIYNTIDGGITWKPQYEDNRFNKIAFSYFGFSTYFDIYGNGIIFNQSANTFKDPNILTTKDYGETFEFTIDSSINNSNYGPENRFVKSKNNLFTWLNDKFQNNRYSRFYFFENNKIKKIKTYDSVSFIRIFQDSEDNLFAITHIRKNAKEQLDSFNIDFYKVMKSTNGGESWSSLNTISQNSDFTKVSFYKNQILMIENYGQNAKLIKDSLGNWLSIPGYSLDSLYLYNIDSGSKTNIFFTKGNTFFENYYLFNNSIYLFGKDTIYENTNILYNYNNWINHKGISNISLRLKYYVENGIAFFDAFDNNQKHLIKLLIKDNINIVENNLEDQTYFYSYPPYPTPSMYEVKSLIYWDMSYNIDDSDIAVYDIYGNKIANKEKISINKLNSYSGYLTWDCSGASTGIYMIQIKHGTNTHNIRAMVVR